jgi:hypothetical protein
MAVPTSMAYSHKHGQEMAGGSGPIRATRQSGTIPEYKPLTGFVNLDSDPRTQDISASSALEPPLVVADPEPSLTVGRPN